MRKFLIVGLLALASAPSTLHAQEACKQMSGTVVDVTGVVQHVFYDSGTNSYTLFLLPNSPCGAVDVRGTGNPHCREQAKAEVKGRLTYQQPIFGNTDIEAIKLLAASDVTCH